MHCTHSMLNMQKKCAALWDCCQVLLISDLCLSRSTCVLASGAPGSAMGMVQHSHGVCHSWSVPLLCN